MNRRLLAARLRRTATLVERCAWFAENPNRAPLPAAIAGLRAEAQALRRLADRLNPKSTKKG